MDKQRGTGPQRGEAGGKRQEERESQPYRAAPRRAVKRVMTADGAL